MTCQWFIDGRCAIASKIAARRVEPEAAACEACALCSPKQDVNRVTVGLAAAQCANDGDGKVAVQIMADHRKVVFTEPKPYKLIPPRQYTDEKLVGDEMAALIKEYGLKPVKSCGCDSWTAKMNEWGIAGCLRNRQAIIDHLNDAYHAATWWDTLRAASNAVMKDLPLTLGGMVDEAIVRARQLTPGN